MPDDIVPELLDKIQKDFNTELNKNKKVSRIRKLIDSGAATYADANEYAIEVGEILAKVYKRHLKADAIW